MGGKRIAVLGDNELLCNAIGLALCSHPELEAVTPLPDPAALDNPFDLIVVAMSSPEGEPLLPLVRASLAEEVGRTPLLLISERPFEARPGEHVAHLAFPFHPDELYHKVQGILESA